MIRLLGILSGAAVAIAILILIIGVPDFVRDVDPEIDPIVSAPIDPIVSAPIDPIVSAPIDPIVSEPVAVTVADVTASTATELTDNATTEAQEPLTESTRDAQQWYAFWSPFRSQIAANGFVAQLQRVTGLDYRIVNIKPGVYEVAFAYADDNEIQTSLSQISAATGLDMPES